MEAGEFGLDSFEGEVPNPSLYSLLGILNFPLEAL